MAKTGRKPIPIDSEQVRKLAELGCRVKEIGDFFGCDEDTILRRFADELEKGRASLRISLRRWQLQAAQKGNVSMLIWLGKQMLDQKDKSQEEIDAMREGVQHTINKGDLIELLRASRKDESQKRDNKTSKEATQPAEGSQNGSIPTASTDSSMVQS